MMETQKILKPSRKILVICDFREKKIIDHLKIIGAAVNKISLEVGDFVCSERVCIEKKTGNDFVSSIIDGRIFEQARALKENFKNPIIIVEGYPTRRINENVLKGATASLIIDFAVPILTTRNPLDTAKTIYWIAKKEQSESKRGMAIKVGKKPKEMKRLQEFIVSGIPGVSLTLARRLLNRFGNIEKIFVAEEGDLQKVNGVGKKLAKRIRKVLTYKY